MGTGSDRHVRQRSCNDILFCTVCTRVLCVNKSDARFTHPLNACPLSGSPQELAGLPRCPVGDVSRWCARVHYAGKHQSACVARVRSWCVCARVITWGDTTHMSASIFALRFRVAARGAPGDHSGVGLCCWRGRRCVDVISLCWSKDSSSGVAPLCLAFPATAS